MEQHLRYGHFYRILHFFFLICFLVLECDSYVVTAQNVVKMNSYRVSHLLVPKNTLNPFMIDLE